MTEHAIIRQVSRNDGSGAYYVITEPDGSEIGGTSKAALARFAKAQGWTVEYIPMPARSRTPTAINGPSDW